MAVTTAQHQIINWIAESSGNTTNPVAIHLVLVNRAMHARGESADLTASTKLSLELFERTAVFRDLKELYTKGLIEFVGPDGKAHAPTEKEIASAGAGENVVFRAIRLTPNALKALFPEESN